jgi:hypothetical protein
MDHPSFMRNGQYTYPMSWAFVDYLLNSGPQRRAIFDRLWSELLEPVDPATACDRAFEGVDLTALEQGFWAHVEAHLDG